VEVSNTLSISLPVWLPPIEDPLAKNKREEVASMTPANDALFSECGIDIWRCSKFGTSILLK
jgi:hypothetical protein